MEISYATMSYIFWGAEKLSGIIAGFSLCIIVLMMVSELMTREKTNSGAMISFFIIMGVAAAINLITSSEYQDLIEKECSKNGGIVFPNSYKCTIIPNGANIIYVDGRNNS